MCETIFISVVMPVYNGEKYLRSSIISILNQTYNNFELIIVNNGSNDGSIKIINSFKDKRIKVLDIKHKIGFEAYNVGFKLSRGEYIFIMDQDDFSHESRIEKQLNYMRENQSDVCGTFFNIVDKNDKMIEQKLLPINHLDIVDELIYKPITIFNPTLCLKKKIFNEVGYFDLKYWPICDYQFYLRIIDKYTLSNIPLFLYNWRSHSKSFSTLNRKKSQEMIKKAATEYIDKYKIRNQFFQKGMIYYYSNNFILAKVYLFKTLVFESFNYKAFKYLIIATFLSIPLRLIRHFKLYNNYFFIKLKNIL